MGNELSHKPPLSYDRLTGFYDLTLKYGLREAVWKHALVRQIQPSSGDRILDLGCGTGTLTLMLHRANPASEIVGIDADTKALSIAQSKATSHSVRFLQSLSNHLPCANSSFDKVVCSLFFHHLNDPEKRDTLEEVSRVLAPAGTFHVAEWDIPQDVLMRAAFVGVQLLDGIPNTSTHITGHFVKMLSGAGFLVSRTARYRTVFGSLGLFCCKRQMGDMKASGGSGWAL